MTLQIAKLSKLLLVMDKGEITSLVGKSLDNINVNVNGEKYRLLFVYLVTVALLCYTCQYVVVNMDTMVKIFTVRGPCWVPPVSRPHLVKCIYI